MQPKPLSLHSGLAARRLEGASIHPRGMARALLVLLLALLATATASPDPTAPMPADVTATPHDANNVTLAWAPPTNTEPLAYRIHVDGHPVATTQETTWTGPQGRTYAVSALYTDQESLPAPARQDDLAPIPGCFPFSSNINTDPPGVGVGFHQDCLRWAYALFPAPYDSMIYDIVVDVANLVFNR